MFAGVNLTCIRCIIRCSQRVACRLYIITCQLTQWLQSKVIYILSRAHVQKFNPHAALAGRATPGPEYRLLGWFGHDGRSIQQGHYAATGVTEDGHLVSEDNRRLTSNPLLAGGRHETEVSVVVYQRIEAANEVRLRHDAFLHWFLRRYE
jgi:hypothetical protein